MQNRRNYYRILHVQPDAPRAVIKASYRTLMRELAAHPDLGGEHWNAALLNEAYEVLGDPGRRGAYDRELFTSYTKRPLPVAAGKDPLISYFCPFCKRPLARKDGGPNSCPSCRSPLTSNACPTDTAARRQNQRALERMRRAGQVRVHRGRPFPSFEGELEDLSVKGMRFRCEERLASGATLKVSCPDLEAVATVRNAYRIFARGTVRYSVGIEFLSAQFSRATDLSSEETA